MYLLFTDEKHKVDFAFRDKDVETFDEMWKEGHSLLDIANKIKRRPTDVLLLALDRAELGKIKKRQNGIFGGI